MIPWIQVYSNLTSHPKTARLAEELKLSSAFTAPNIIAVGILVGIWTWAIQNAYDGDLSECSATVIADACRWKKKPETLIAALKKSEFLDDNMHLHDWEEYAVLIMDAEDNRREKTRERVKRYRDKRRNADVTECNGYSNATDTPCNAPTIPNHTIHNITIPNKTLRDKGINSRGSGSRAQESDPVEDYLDEYGLNADSYYGVDDEVRRYVSQLTQGMFLKFSQRKPTPLDELYVLRIATEGEHDTEGKWTRRINYDAQNLLLHAFRLAAESGKDGDWKYINGILKNYTKRGIKTVDDAEEFEAERTLVREETL